MSTGPALALTVLLLALNAFFVGAEFALISARRSAIEPRAQEGGMGARITLKAMENVSIMLAGAQLGVTVCSLGLGYLGEPAIAHALQGPFETIGLPHDLIHPVAFAIALTIISYLHIVLGEMVPKNLALAGPDRAALVLAPPLVWLVRALRPFILALNWVANHTLRLIGVTPKDEVASAFTRDEVAGLVDESRREGLLDDDEEALLTGALEFEQRRVRSVLLATDTLVTLPLSATPADVEALAASTSFSRFPVIRDGDLVGYLHLKDALELEDRHRTRPIAESWVRPLVTVNADDGLRAALTTMQRSSAHLGRVIDSTGAVLGVVALEDVLEELVGEIRDEAVAS